MGDDDAWLMGIRASLRAAIDEAEAELAKVKARGWGDPGFADGYLSALVWVRDELLDEDAGGAGEGAPDD